MAREQNGSIGAGVFWIIFLSVLLGWLPVVGAFLAGFIGGRKSGGVGNAIAAVFLPGILVAGLLFYFGAGLTGIPLLGAIAGTGGLILCLIHAGPLLLGAIIGGLIA
jgi:hypothetical protein